MNTVANAKEKNSVSASATAFISATTVSAAALIVDGFFHSSGWHPWEFVGLLLIATLTARLKVKLPGLNSNMSVSLPFLLIAMTRLSLIEAVATAAVSVFTQSVPKLPHKFNPVHALFNVATSVLATGLGWEVFHRTSAMQSNSTAALLLGSVAYLLASTMPVATIISLTEHCNLLKVWSDIAHLSFPYYVASTGLASIALSLEGQTTWSLLVGMSLVSVVMYHSYRRYFVTAPVSAAVNAGPENANGKAAAASA